MTTQIFSIVASAQKQQVNAKAAARRQPEAKKEFAKKFIATLEQVNALSKTGKPVFEISRKPAKGYLDDTPIVSFTLNARWQPEGQRAYDEDAIYHLIVYSHTETGEVQNTVIKKQYEAHLRNDMTDSGFDKDPTTKIEDVFSSSDEAPEDLATSLVKYLIDRRRLDPEKLKTPPQEALTPAPQ